MVNTSVGHEMVDIPKDFLKTVDSIAHFAETMLKIRKAADEKTSVILTADEAQAMIWGLQILKSGAKDERQS